MTDPNIDSHPEFSMLRSVESAVKRRTVHTFEITPLRSLPLGLAGSSTFSGSWESAIVFHT